MNAPLLDAPKFETGRSDPRLAECLKEFPSAIFSERLYQSIELMERYSIELAVDLLGQLNLAEQLDAWRSADGFANFFVSSRVSGFLTLDANAPGRNRCVEVQSDSRVRSYRLRKTPWQPISNVCAPSRSILTPGTRRPWICWDHAQGFWIVATAKKSGIKICSDLGRPAWLTIFTTTI